MVDQYKMNQYKKETSQIHAPADLIRRTKEAVREEEQRLERERMQQSNAVQPRPSYGKVYRWVLPVAAAVFCVIMLNVSGTIVGRKLNGGSSGSSMDMASESAPSGAASSGSHMGAQSGAAEWSGAADKPINENSDYYMAEAAEAEEAVTTEGYDGGQTADTSASVESDGIADSSFENDAGTESGTKNTGNSYIESVYGTKLWIEEAEKTPAFYDNPDTECVTIQGIELYVGKDFDDAWAAYVQTGTGKYIISTELTESEISLEEFAQAAYELLMETF